MPTLNLILLGIWSAGCSCLFFSLEPLVGLSLMPPNSSVVQISFPRMVCGGVAWSHTTSRPLSLRVNRSWQPGQHMVPSLLWKLKLDGWAGDSAPLLPVSLPVTSG